MSVADMELTTLLVLLCSGQIVGASLRLDCTSVHNGIYFNNNCYVYTHVRRNWGDTMTYCMSLGGDKYKSYIAHVLSSEILKVIELLAGNLITTWKSYVFACWIGAREGSTGPDPAKSWWKFKFYTSLTTYEEYPLNKMYIVQNMEHHFDPYEHYNSALTMIYNTNGASGQLQIRRSSSPVNGFYYYAVCQINDHIRNFERVGRNLRVVRPPVLQEGVVGTLAKCAKLCGQQPLCLGFNYADSRSMINSTNCEALTWLMVDAGPNYAQNDKGWSYYERAK